MKIRTCFLAAAMLLLAVSPSWANLITNGSFETFVIAGTDVDFGGFVRFSPPPNTDITDWTITGSSGGTRTASISSTASATRPLREINRSIWKAMLAHQE
jgi:hypothetical protein